MASDRRTFSKYGFLYSFNLTENQEESGCTIECDVVRFINKNQNLSSARTIKSLNIAHRPSTILSASIVFFDDLQDSIPCCLIGTVYGNVLCLTLCAVDNGRLSMISRVEHSPVVVQQTRSEIGHQWENISAWIVDRPRVVCVIDGRLYINDSLGDSISMSLSYLPIFDKAIQTIYCVKTIPPYPSPETMSSPNMHNGIPHQGHTFIFGTVCKEQPTGELEFICFSIDFNRKVFSLDCDIVPRDYCDNIAAAELLTIRFIKSDEPSTNSFKTETEVCICTTAGQLLLFSCGYLQRCIHLPLKNPVSVSEISTFQSFTGQDFITIFSSMKSQCIVVKDANQKYETVQFLDGINFAVMDDFTECGAEQLLMGSHSVTSLNLNQFVLSDFSGLYINKMKEPDEASQLGGGEHEQEGNVLSVVQALGSRVQAGYGSLTVARRMLDTKAHVIQKSSFSLTAMKEKEEVKEDSFTPMTTFPLIDLFTGKYQHSQEVSTITTRSDLEVQCAWQKLIIHKLIIGLQCKNAGHRTITCPHLTIVSKAPWSKVTLVESECFSLVRNKPGQNAETTKRIKVEYCQTEPCTTILPGEETIITAAMDVPCLKNNNVEASGLLEWAASAAPSSVYEMSNEGPILLPDLGVIPAKTSDHSFLYRLTTSVSEIFSGKYDIDLNQSQQDKLSRNMVALNSVQQRQDVTVTSLHIGRLSNIVSSALENMGFTLWNGVTPLTYVFSQPGPLQWVRCTIQDKMYCKLNAVLWTWGEEQLALFIHAWYKTLPQDVVVHPGHSSQMGIQVAKLLECLLTEASFGLEVIKDLTMEPKTSEDAMTNMKSWEGDGIKRYFAEKRRLSHINVDICKEKYKQFMKQSDHMAQNTDRKAMDIEGY